MFIDRIKVGDILLTSEGSKREIVVISDQEEVEYPIITIDPSNHNIIDSYSAEGKFMTSRGDTAYLIAPISRGTILVADKDGKGDFIIVMVTDYRDQEEYIFSGVVIYDTVGKAAGKKSNNWLKKNFKPIESDLVLTN